MLISTSAPFHNKLAFTCLSHTPCGFKKLLQIKVTSGWLFTNHCHIVGFFVGVTILQIYLFYSETD